MPGTNLELLKFSVYLFFPVGMMYYCGNPRWYFEHVFPFKEKFFPEPETTNKALPQDHSALRQELDRIKSERRAKRIQREALERPTERPT